MAVETEPRLRLFSCESGRRHLDKIRQAIEALDATVIVHSEPNQRPPRTDFAIAIWDGQHTPGDPNFFREVAYWEKRNDTELFLCRMAGEEIANYPINMFDGIFEGNERPSLGEWLLNNVLKFKEQEQSKVKVRDAREALILYRQRLSEFLLDNRHHSGLHTVQEKPVVDTYIPLTLKSSNNFELSASQEEFHAIISGGQRQFVLGLPGTGKSTFCNLIAYYAAKNADPEGNLYFPVPLRARNIVDLGYDNLVSSIRMMVKRVVGHGGKHVSDLILEDEDLPKASCAVFIDGLDELNDDERSRLRLLLNPFELLYPHCAIIISSRPSAHDPSKWSDYQLYRLKSLTVEEALGYVEEFGVESSSQALQELIQGSEQIRELASVPFMLTLMANYAGETDDFPKYRATLIGKCIVALVSLRRRLSKPILDDQSLIDCLSYISNRLFKINPTGNHTESEFRLAVHAYLSEQAQWGMVSTAPGEAADIALQEIINGTALLQKTGDYVEFVHRTVWEFFVANFIVSELEYDIVSFANQVVWEEPIRIACGLISEEKVGRFVDPLWSANPGLAIRALSESPFDIDKHLVGGLERISAIQVRDIVQDLLDTQISTAGRFGSERMALDTLKVLLPMTRDAEVLWLSILLCASVNERCSEAKEVIVSRLGLDDAVNRYHALATEIGFVDVPGGSFNMGSDTETGDVDEVPRHKVTIPSLTISKISLRNRDVRSLPFDVGRFDERSPTDDHPVIQVTWFEAQLAAIWYGCRLPTEAEWEYCCRSGGLDDTEMFAEELVSKYAWHSGNSDKQTQIGALREPNQFGLYDMLGNVREWCSDWFQGDLYLERVGKETINPSGPAVGEKRVLKGGCYDYNTANLYASNRHSHLPSTRGKQNGFRIVRGMPAELWSVLDLKCQGQEQ